MPDAPSPTASATHRVVDAVWRMESAKLIAALTRVTGDVGVAEELAQDALVAALERWPETGVPDKPGAWLMATAKHRAIDTFRRAERLERKTAELGRELREAEEPDWAAALDEVVEDDLLRLVFISCHPVLSREARVALTLRVLGGLTSDEIARAFLVPTATVQARITRAKKTIAAAQVPFELPPPEERHDRLGSVLSVIYVIFTEGSTATSGADWIRTDLAREAVRLARVLAHLVPDETETQGLLALLELTAARFPARLDQHGEPVLLEQQDRSRWDRAAIRRGSAALAGAVAVGRGLGAYGLQAAIAECHAVAASVDDTDWERIVVLYEALARLAPSPVVTLNGAVALSMAEGPAAALPVIDGLVASGALEGSHLLPSVRGELLARLGRIDEARDEFDLAVRLCGNEREQGLLRAKRDALG
jgi:RNA polymerase sigma factor (sigma-70 family)